MKMPFAIIWIVAVCVATAFYRESWKTEVANKIFLNIRHTEEAVTARVAGYPARAELLTPNRFYKCEASIVEIRPDRTNCFVVLHEFSPETDGAWKSVGTNRLIEVPTALQLGTIYSVTHLPNGGIVYKAVDRVR